MNEKKKATPNTYLGAICICQKLDSEDYSDEEKGLAIHKILSMESINAVNKDTLLGIIRYLFPLCFEWEGEE